MTTITLPLDKVARNQRNIALAFIPQLEELERQVTARQEQAAREKQALGNYNIDAVTCLRAAGALYALRSVVDLSDGMIEMGEANQP